MALHELCKLASLDEAVPLCATIGELEVVVIRCGTEIYCVENNCSHENFALSDGEVDPVSCEIECARHGSMFDLATGEPRSLPATKPVRTFPVVVHDGVVSVEVP